MSIAPLAGYTVAVTADRRREEQVELLRRRGADVVTGATVRTEPLGDEPTLAAAIAAVIAQPPDITVLLTGLGVRSLLGAAESMGVDGELLEVVAGSEVYARGPKATGAAVTAGIDVAWATPGERSTEIVAELADRARAGARIAVVRDGDSRPNLANALATLGADAVDIPVYRWTMPDDLVPAHRLLESVCAGAVDAVTFTSSPSVRNLFALAERVGCNDQLLDALHTKVLAVCVGPVCAETAKEVGIETALTPKRARLGTMVQALAAELSARARHLSLRGVDVTLQGALAVVGAEEVRLTERERSVLHLLADANGAVVPKRTMLRGVWGDASADEHTVEVTVSRLRRRLGAAGSAVQTVPRRGYRLA
jgi:uroporphyrinogen-III synthase